MNILTNWVITLCCGRLAAKGDRVMTPKGSGTITNGTVQVNLDCYEAHHFSDLRNQTFNIDQVKMK